MSKSVEKEEVATPLHCLYCFHTLWCKLSKLKAPDFPWPLPHGHRKMGLFVTWSKKLRKEDDYDLRGCLGTFSEDMPISEGLKKYAIYSALQDKRFHPIAIDEISLLKCHVSLLHSFRQAKDLDDWVIGQHGVTLSFQDDSGQHFSATYLPEIALEQNWSKSETIRHLLSKAGYKKSLSSTKNARLMTYESCKADLTWEECVIQYCSLNVSPNVMVESFRSFSCLPYTLSHYLLQDRSTSSLSLSTQVADSTPSLSAPAVYSNTNMSSTSSMTNPKDREKEKEKEKETVVIHKGNSLLDLFTRKYSNTLDASSSGNGSMGLSSLNKARRDIDLIESRNSKRTTFDSSLVNRSLPQNAHTEEDDDDDNGNDNDEEEEEESHDDDDDDDNENGEEEEEEEEDSEESEDEEKEDKRKKSREKEGRRSGMGKRPNTLSAPAHRKRTQSEDSSGVGPSSSSSSSCNTLSGDDLSQGHPADDTNDRQRLTKSIKSTALSYSPAPHFVLHKDKDKDKGKDKDKYRDTNQNNANTRIPVRTETEHATKGSRFNATRHDTDSESSSAETDGQAWESSASAKTENKQRSKQKEKEKGKEKKKEKGKKHEMGKTENTQLKKKSKNVQTKLPQKGAHDQSDKEMKVSVMVNRSRRERGNDVAKRKHSPMSSSPPARNVKGESSHEEEQHPREDSRDVRMVSHNKRGKEENGGKEEEEEENEANQEQEENVGVDFAMYDTALRTTDKKTQGSYDVSISRKRKDRTCRAEEKRVNSFIVDEERTDAMTISEEA